MLLFRCIYFFHTHTHTHIVPFSCYQNPFKSLIRVDWTIRRILSLHMHHAMHIVSNVSFVKNVNEKRDKKNEKRGKKIFSNCGKGFSSFHAFVSDFILFRFFPIFSPSPSFSFFGYFRSFFSRLPLKVFIRKVESEEM